MQQTLAEANPGTGVERTRVPAPASAEAAVSPGAAARTAAAHAAIAERDRRLTRETARQLTRAGLARHFVPRRWGGTEGTFSALLTAVAEVGEGCASAAWCGGLFAAHSRFAAYLPHEGQRDLWEHSPDVRIVAGIKPSGEARPVAGGWLLSGEWQRVSGVDHAAWALLCATEQGGGPGSARLFAVPRGDLSVLDTWGGTGMRGTGSHTAVVGSAFVPRHRTFPAAELMIGGSGAGRAPCHVAPAQLVGGLIFCAPALGAARRALGEWTRWGAGATRRPLDRGEEHGLHDALARSTSEIEAAQLMLRDAARRADSGRFTERNVLRNRRMAAAAADLLVTSVERLFRAGGVHTADGMEVLERCWRDVHTVAAHKVLRHDPAAAAYGAAVFAAPAAREAGPLGATATAPTAVTSPLEVSGAHA